MADMSQEEIENTHDIRESQGTQDDDDDNEAISGGCGLSAGTDGPPSDDHEGMSEGKSESDYDNDDQLL